MRTEADRIEVDTHHDGDGVTQARAPRFGILLLAMLAELTLAPFIIMATGTLTIARWVGALVLLAALSVAGSHRVAIALFSGALIFHLASMVSETTAVGAAAETFRLLFLSYVFGLIVWRVVHDRIVTLDTVAGAACAYFLLGVVWGDLFLLVDRWRPGSFAIPTGWMVGPGGICAPRSCTSASPRSPRLATATSVPPMRRRAAYVPPRRSSDSSTSRS